MCRERHIEKVFATLQSLIHSKSLDRSRSKPLRKLLRRGSEQHVWGHLEAGVLLLEERRLLFANLNLQLASHVAVAFSLRCSHRRLEPDILQHPSTEVASVHQRTTGACEGRCLFVPSCQIASHADTVISPWSHRLLRGVCVVESQPAG